MEIVGKEFSLAVSSAGLLARPGCIALSTNIDQQSSVVGTPCESYSGS